jgi:anti-sigma factor RsiW
VKNELSFHDLQALSAYLDRQLDAKEQAHLEQRLKTDADLRDALDDLRRMQSLLRSQPILRAPRNFTLTPEMAGSPRKVPAYPVFRLVAAFASVLLVVLILGDLLGRSASPAAAPALMEMREAMQAAPEPADQAQAPLESGASTVYLYPPAELEAAAPLAKKADAQATPPPEAALEAAVIATPTVESAEAALQTNLVPIPSSEAADQAAAEAKLAEQPEITDEATADTLHVETFAVQAVESEAAPLEPQIFGIEQRLWRAAEILLALLAVGAGLAWWSLHRRS